MFSYAAGYFIIILAGYLIDDGSLLSFGAIWLVIELLINVIFDVVKGNVYCGICISQMALICMLIVSCLSYDSRLT